MARSRSARSARSAVAPKDDDTPLKLEELLRRRGIATTSLDPKVEKILQRHGTMSSTTLRSEFGVAATDEKLRETRGEPRDRKAIRKWLNVRRKKITAEEEALIWRKLCELYFIPVKWPLDIRHYLLAGFLSAELFKRCAALWKPHGGGPSKKRQAEMAKRKRELLPTWEAYCRNARVKGDLPWARFFMKDEKNREACAAAGLTSPKAFVQAMNEISSGTPR
jgi:hypothetical protein